MSSPSLRRERLGLSGPSWVWSMGCFCKEEKANWQCRTRIMKKKYPQQLLHKSLQTMYHRWLNFALFSWNNSLKYFVITIEECLVISLVSSKVDSIIYLKIYINVCRCALCTSALFYVCTSTYTSTYRMYVRVNYTFFFSRVSTNIINVQFSSVSIWILWLGFT
jgi:hypothetical protein